MCICNGNLGMSGSDSQQLAIFRTEVFPVTGREIEQLQRPDGDAHQPQGGQTDCGGHASDLAVFALGEGQLDPAGGDGGAKTNRWMAGSKHGLFVQYRGDGPGHAVALDLQRSVLQCLHLGFIGHAFHLHAVGARVFVAGVQEPVNQRFFVAEQQQALGVAVEPANRRDILWHTIISKRAMFRQLTGELR